VKEFKVSVDDRSVMVRDAGDARGVPVVHFHGTPGSRLEPGFGDEIARHLGIRVISFDRPGYGQSGAAVSSLQRVARDVEAIVDELGIAVFATFGWSGGGPFALAAAATMPGRVTRVGVSGGLAPTQEMPNARDALTQNDISALSYLPDDPIRSAESFRQGNEELLDAMMGVRDDEQAPWIDWMWGESDPKIVGDATVRQALHGSFREALRQGPMAIAWDNVAFIGPWGFDLAEVKSPVRLWYGDRDQMAPVANGRWLQRHLPEAELVVYHDGGHLLPLEHCAEMLQAVTAGD
jgi:pimeloyl-ACP methyl ester carboxylesterase